MRGRLHKILLSNFFIHPVKRLFIPIINPLQEFVVSMDISVSIAHSISGYIRNFKQVPKYLATGL
jgi:hypothetical protein